MSSTTSKLPQTHSPPSTLTFLFPVGDWTGWFIGKGGFGYFCIQSTKQIQRLFLLLIHALFCCCVSEGEGYQSIFTSITNLPAYNMIHSYIKKENQYQAHTLIHALTQNLEWNLKAGFFHIKIYIHIHLYVYSILHLFHRFCLCLFLSLSIWSRFYTW